MFDEKKLRVLSYKTRLDKLQEVICLTYINGGKREHFYHSSTKKVKKSFSYELWKIPVLFYDWLDTLNPSDQQGWRL